MLPDSFFTHKDGMSISEPENPNVILKFVGTWSEHDPSWEVCSQKYQPFYHIAPQSDPSHLRTDADL